MENTEENAEKPKKKNTRRWCSVPLCKSRNTRTLHKFPSDPEMRKKWAIACRIGKKVTEYMLVCGDHFLRTDFIPRWDGNLKRLKNIAIPSQNLPTRPLDKKLTTAQLKRKEDRAARAAKRLERLDIPRKVPNIIRKPKIISDVLSTQTSDIDLKSIVGVVKNNNDGSNTQNEDRQQTSNVEENMETMSNESVNNVNSSESSFCEQDYRVCECGDDNDWNSKNYESYETKAAKILVEISEMIDKMMKREEIIYSVKDAILKRIDEFYSSARRLHKIVFFSLFKNDHQLHAYTGIDFQLLNNLTKTVIICEDDSSKKFDITVEGRIFLCLIKIRLNLTFRSLANLFHLTEQNCKMLFFNTLQSLKIILKSAIYWPTTDEILKVMPECFENLKKTVAVIDATEIAVKKQMCFKCRLPHSSPYDGGENLKILLGFAKCGLITYVGRAICGSASNERIEDENFISKVLVPNCDAIMTDGYFIEQECNKAFIELTKARQKPPFCPDSINIVKGKIKAPIEDHIEHAVTRFKKFKILQSELPSDLVSVIDDISVVICGIVNLSNPIVASKKF